MDSYFQDGVKLKGILHSKGVLHIGGEFEGELFSTDHLVIGKGGFVKGTIKTFDLTNMGKIEGDVAAENKVNLKEESEVEGDISTYQLIVDEGSNFEGRCKMTKAKPETKTPFQPRKKDRIEPKKEIKEIEKVGDDLVAAAQQISQESFQIPESQPEKSKQSAFAFFSKIPKNGKNCRRSNRCISSHWYYCHEV